MTAVQKGAVDVIALATGVILAPAEAWTRMLAAMQSNSELREELLRLEQENRVLKGRTQRLASVLAENARYRALLNSARDVEDQLIAAKIIAISPDPARHVVVIDKGSLDGIEQGQELCRVRAAHDPGVLSRIPVQDMAAHLSTIVPGR